MIMDNIADFHAFSHFFVTQMGNEAFLRDYKVIADAGEHAFCTPDEAVQKELTAMFEGIIAGGIKDVEDIIGEGTVVFQFHVCIHVKRRISKVVSLGRKCNCTALIITAKNSYIQKFICQVINRP